MVNVVLSTAISIEYYQAIEDMAIKEHTTKSKIVNAILTGQRPPIKVKR